MPSVADQIIQLRLRKFGAGWTGTSISPTLYTKDIQLEVWAVKRPPSVITKSQCQWQQLLVFPTCYMHALFFLKKLDTREVWTSELQIARSPTGLLGLSPHTHKMHGGRCSGKPGWPIWPTVSGQGTRQAYGYGFRPRMHGTTRTVDLVKSIETLPSLSPWTAAASGSVHVANNYVHDNGSLSAIHQCRLSPSTRAFEWNSVSESLLINLIISAS